MKLEIIFEKFDQFADAPEAVAKLRELVLHLAFSGRIIEQTKSSDTAEGLLSQVDALKASLVKGGGVRRSSTLFPQPSQYESDGLPKTWLCVPLGRIAVMLVDGSHNPPPKRESGVPMLSSKNILNGTITCDASRLISEEEFHSEQQRAPVAFGDVLLTIVGTIGRSAVVSQNSPRFALQRSVALIRTGVDSHYLSYYLRSPHAFRYYDIEAKGTAQRGIYLGTLSEMPIPLPPLAEQKRIVAKVDELMALCDRLEAQQQERETRHAALARASLARFADAPTPANLHFIFHPSYGIPPTDLRKSILTLAVQGKLVPQDPNDELAFVATDSQFDAPFDVPENWTWARLGDLQPEFQNGASSRGDKEGTPVIVIRLADIENRRISLDDPRAIDISVDQVAKYGLQRGDTLITRVNGSADIVGTFIPVQETMEAIYCDHFIRMRITPDQLSPAYTALVGDSQLVRDQIRALFITTAGQKTVNQGHIRSLCIPLPPVAEQRRIVAKVEQLMALVDALETQLAASRRTRADLMEAVVAELTAGF